MEGISPQLFQIILTLIGSILGSGAAVTLVKFFVERNDNKKKEQKLEQKEAEQDKWEEFREECKQEVNILREEVKLSLQERDNTGFQRYNEHKDAILELTKNVDKLTTHINKNSTTLNILGESLIGLEHDKIIFITDRITRRKYITLKEKATLDALYIPYSKLGGNGDCKVGYNHCINLPVITDEEACKMDKEIQKKDLGL